MEWYAGHPPSKRRTTLVSSNVLVYPLFVMAILPGTILLLLTYHRALAIRKGLLEAHYLEDRGAEHAPPLIVKLTHNLNNLFEFPVLFYVAVCIIITTHNVDAVYAAIAWAYVAVRYVHTLVHISYNNVTHRAAIHMISDIILIFLWVRLFVNAL